MLSLNINGRQVLVKSDPDTPLLWVSLKSFSKLTAKAMEPAT